ncbi:MAG: hypothetical protein SGPRY_005072 [Prymnesium sp.]
MSETLTQQSIYRDSGSSYQGSLPLASTLSHTQAFSSSQPYTLLPPAINPLERLSFVGARDERIISGTNRYKYFRRPIIPFMSVQPPEVLFAPTAQTDTVLAPPPPEPEPSTRTVECQSDYRETETQTLPYTPDYVLRPGEDPEILVLNALKFNEGLPAGMNEVRMIERARDKRTFEASLPPMTDESSLALRRKMMSEQELRDWGVREDQIFEMQQQKLLAFETGLRAEAEERELHWDERIEDMRQIKLTEKDKEISQIQRRRIKALRKLSEARKNVEQKKEPRDIVSEYADYGSEVYAPLSRSGLITRDKLAHQYETKPVQLNSLEGLLELERSSAAAKMLEPKQIDRPAKEKAVLDFKERRERRMQEELDRTDLALKAAKQAKPSEKEQKEQLLAAYRDTKPIDRPPTPSVVPPPHDESIEVASILLQRLLRGRAIQNMMYEGKERRLELIKELRTDEGLAVQDTENDDTVLTQAAADEAAIDSVSGLLIGTTLDEMSKELRRTCEERRIHEIILEAERTRRIRQCEESGRRQKELKEREEQQECVRQIMLVHNSSAASYIDDLCSEVVEEVAKSQAQQEAELKSSRLTQVIDRLEERHSNPRAIAGELVNNFVIPEVQRLQERRANELETRKFGNASRRALSNLKDVLEETLLSQVEDA